MTEEEVEKSFGSNLCRCTGYRPILEAFKSLAVNPNHRVLKKIQDIEDIDQQTCPKNGVKCGGSCDVRIEDWCFINVKNMTPSSDLPKKIHLSDGRLWCAVNNVTSIFQVLDEIGYDSYMLVAGNTARGGYIIIIYDIIKDQVT